jgi:hypothetical protein
VSEDVGDASFTHVLIAFLLQTIEEPSRILPDDWDAWTQEDLDWAIRNFFGYVRDEQEKFLAVTPSSMRTSARASARPPVHLVVLVLIWLVLIGGPVAGEKLSAEMQTMLSTEVGTVALGLAITQYVNQNKKK